MSHGAHFCKADLHVHTPASHDYGDRAATPAEILKAASAQQIDLLAITDHNSADFVDKMRAAAKSSSVTVVPGVEVTTPEGHILGLFAAHTSATDITDLLIRIGIPRAKHGEEEAISSEHAEDVIREIHRMGGVAIAAHANEKGIGIMQQKGRYKMALVPMPELAALEFTRQDDIDKFSKGRVSADYPPKACTQSSDAHSVAEIGRRVTYLKMQERSAYGISQALLDYEARVRFPWNLPESTHPRILSLKVDQGFFAEEEFLFHENLNCLVGGQGAGKSTVVELLRYCFGDVSSFEHIRVDHMGKLEKLLGHGGKVEVQYFDADGEVKTISRDFELWDTDRAVSDQAGNPVTIETEPVLFSQGELVETARSPMAQLELIDRHLDLNEENETERAAIAELRTNAAQIQSTTNSIERLSLELDHQENGLTATTLKHDELKVKLRDPILQEFPRWQAEQRYVQNLRESLGQIESAFKEAIDAVDVEPLDLALPADAPNRHQLDELANLLGKVETALRDAKAEFTTVIKQLTKDVETKEKAIRPSYNAQRIKHAALVAGLGSADTKKAHGRFEALEKRLIALQLKVGERTKLESKLAQDKKERGQQLSRLDSARQRRYSKRKAKAAEYEAALKNILQIAVEPLGDRSAFQTALRSLCRGGRVHETDQAKIVKAMSPSELVAIIQNNDSDTLATRASIGRDAARRLVDSSTQKDSNSIYELEVVDLPDLPAISYFAEPGRLKPVHHLSTGQKGTVIISLALIEGPGPLVVDHPEEPLDTKSVYGQVVSKLREGKERRQFIFTTHNANIAVGADADLNHILGATADRGTIESRGAIDDAKTNELLLLHLEGGSAALARRIKKYRTT